MRILALSLVLYALVGCNKSSSSPNEPAGNQPNVTALAVHKANECPSNIEGVYEGKGDSGQKLTVEFSKNTEGVLIFKLTMEGDEANAQTVPVDGQKHTFPGTDATSYISMGCENSAINSVSQYKEQKYTGQDVVSDTELKMESFLPNANVRKFTRKTPSETVQQKSANAHATDDSSTFVENLKPGELKLQLVSPELATRLATDQDLVIVKGRVQNADPSLTNQIMCFLEDNSGSQFSKGDKFEVILVEKGEKNNSQRFYVYLHKTDVPVSVRQAIGCRISGLTHKFTVAELKDTVRNMFESVN